MLKNKRFLKTLVIFSLIFIIFVPRFWYFWKLDFTGDEATHARKAVSVATGIKGLITFDNPTAALKNIYIPILEHNHPPLEFLILIPFGLVEPREFSARLVYIIFNCVVLISSYLFLRKYVEKKLSVYFFILFGTSVYVVWWSQTAIYVSLAIAAGAFMAIAMSYFYKLPSKVSLFYLCVTQAFGLLVFADFIFFLPANLWLIWEKRKLFEKSDFIKPLFLLFSTAGIFYFLYIGYSLSGGPNSAGFNYVINQKLASSVDPLKNLVGYWNNFFGYPGVVVLLPFVLFSPFLSRKIRYIKYFYLTIFIYVAVFVFKSPTPFHYLASTFGMFLLLTSEVLKYFKMNGPIIIGFIILINSVSLFEIISGTHNPQLFDLKAPNNAGAISRIARACVVGDNETYISWDDPWKTAYYLGRNSTVEKDGTEARVETIREFLNGDLTNIVLVDVKNDLIDEDTHRDLKKRSTKSISFDRETVYLFKNCY